MRQQKFAFGENAVTVRNEYESLITCACPATKAGFDPDSDAIIHVAEAYDDIIRDQYSENFSGIINESTAKEAWNKAIRELDHKEHYDHNQYETAVKQAENVKNRLGWS